MILSICNLPTLTTSLPPHPPSPRPPSPHLIFLPLYPSPSTPSPLLPQPIRHHPQNLPHVTFYLPPSSPRESGGGGGGEEGGSVGEGSRRESLANPTSTRRGSVGEEPPAERYGCLGGCAFNLADVKPSDTQ